MGLQFSSQLDLGGSVTIAVAEVEMGRRAKAEVILEG